MIGILKISARLLCILTILTGCVYPLVLTGLAQAIFPEQAQGSLLVEGGQVRGSLLIGQSFQSERYFHGRPSAGEYDGLLSGGSNAGPSAAKLHEEVGQRAMRVRQTERLTPQQPVPADLVTASASGLDPHISPEAAMLQAQRVAQARGLSLKQVETLVYETLEERHGGFLGERRVNVLKLNQRLDRN